MAIGFGALLSAGMSILDKVIPDPKQKAEAKLKLLSLEQSGDLKELEAARDVLVAEAKSEHWVTATWRPITMLTFVVIIANNYILAPYIMLFFNTNVSLALPPEMWALLKIGLGGYVVGRSVEKAANVLGKGRGT